MTCQKVEGECITDDQAMQCLKKEEEERLRKKQEKAQKSSGKIKLKNTKEVIALPKNPKSDVIETGKGIRKKRTAKKKVQIIESDTESSKMELKDEPQYTEPVSCDEEYELTGERDYQ